MNRAELVEAVAKAITDQRDDERWDAPYVDPDVCSVGFLQIDGEVQLGRIVDSVVPLICESIAAEIEVALDNHVNSVWSDTHVVGAFEDSIAIVRGHLS